MITVSRSHSIRLAAGLLIAVVVLSLLAPGSVHAQACSNAQVAPTTPTADFELHPDGTAFHQPTGLMWMRCSLGQVWNGTTCTGGAINLPVWGTALQTIGLINAGESDADGDGAPGFAGYTDWRLPNVKELVSITEACRINPALNEFVFPNAPLASNHWSSTTLHRGPVVAWYWDSQSGLISFTIKTDTLPRNVKLVRGGAGAGSYVAGSFRVFRDGFEQP
jgi:hypothetical protein